MQSFKKEVSVTPRFFSTPIRPITSSPILDLIKRLFHDFPQNMRNTLIHAIVANQCKRAEELQKSETRIVSIISQIPASMTYDAKIAYLNSLMRTYYASPVLTAHPTRVLSNRAIYVCDHLVATAIEWATHHRGSPESLACEKNIRADIEILVQQSLLPSENLTPQKEADFANYIYKNILDAFPEFLKLIVDTFASKHGGSHEKIKSELQASVMLSFQNVWSWVIADLDGNPNKTAQTMERMIPSLQSTMIDLYLKRLLPVRKLSDRLKGAYAYLERCKIGMMVNICFSVAGGNRAKKRFLSILDNEIHTNAVLSSTEKDQLTSLRELVNMAGFWGGLKEFVRQSSKVNSDVFDEFCIILSDFHDNILTLMKGSAGTIRPYHNLSLAEKTYIHNLLSNNPFYFETLKQNASRFSAETKKELKRLQWVLKHRDIFTSYITSDTIDIISLKEVVLLIHFSAHQKDLLHIGDISQSPVNLLPLCETPHDLTNLVTIVTAMLEDANLRALIVERKMLSYVAGPSDLGKVGGVFTLVQLIWAGKDVEDLLEKYKLKYPEMAPVVLSILYGLGGDTKRRVSEAKRQLHSTFQGSDAHSSLGSPGAYGYYLGNVIGGPSENTLRAKELRLLEQEHPAYLKTLQYIIKQAIDGYQTFNEQSSTKELLKKLTVANIGSKLNTSSRSEAKNAKPQDISKSRAIGLVNYYLMTGVLWDTFMGAEALVHLDPNIHAHMPFLFEQSTTIQEIVYKVIYAIAVSDIPRSWKKLNHGIVPSFEQIKEWALTYRNPGLIEKQHHHVLAHIDMSSRLILKAIVKFLPLSQQKHLQHHMMHADASKPSHQVALELLDVLGCIDTKFKQLADEIRFDLLPRHRRLHECIDAYFANHSADNAVNLVLACRGDERLTGGLVAISQMTSRLVSMTPVVQAQESAEAEPIYAIRSKL